jgi:flagellar biosynthetic protein FlhB
VSGEKTEKPTAKRRKELRKKGVHARSMELPQAVALFTLVIAVPMAIGNLVRSYRWDMASFLGSAGTSDLSGAGSLTKQMIIDGVHALVLPVVLVMAASVLTSVGVTRERPSIAALRPKFQGLNPKYGFKRVFGVQGLSDALRAFIKLALLIGVGYAAFRAGITHVTSNGAGPEADLSIIGSTASSLLLKVAVVALVVGVADAAWQRRRYGKQSKMSKHEVREEHKQQEVNAQVRSAIRSKQFALSRSRMIAAVERADVVLANPTHLVVALSYQPGTMAPVVVAKGAGAIAQRIKDEAAKHGVPVVEDKPLARAIYGAADIGDTIPEELFRAVAQILATIYSTRKRRGQTIYRATLGPPPKVRSRSKRRRIRTAVPRST